MSHPFKTRGIRRAAPSVARAGANVFSDLARRTKFVDPNLADHWPSIAGADIARLARPGRLTGHKSAGQALEIYVRSGAAAAEMQMRADDLLSRLNRYFGPGTVTRITIRQHAGAPPQKAASAPVANPGADKSELGQALSSFRAAINRRNEQK